MAWWVLRRQVHVSWLIAAASTGVVTGVIGAQYVMQTQMGSFVWLIAALLLGAVGVWRGKVYAIGFLLLAGFIVGLWRGSVTQTELVPWRLLIGQTATVQGVVSEDPDKGKNDELVLRLGSLNIEDHAIAGALWVSAGMKPDIKRGDIVTLQGKLSPGFGSFAASMYRATIVKAQRPQPGDMAGRVRDWFASGVRMAVDEPEASLGIGYVVGQRRSLPPELDEALRVAGLTHIIVASGYNLTILVRLTRRLFMKVSKYMAACSASFMIIAFILITGASPSMSRAGLIAGLSLLAWYYGRKFHPLVLLPFAAAITLLVSPSYGWNDIGWQLSFAAFGGVILVAPLMQRFFFGEAKPGTIRQILGETTAAQLCTAPILIVAFGQLSSVAVISNLLILPLVPLAMLLTFVAGVGALLLPLPASLLGAPAEALLGYMTSVAQYMAHIPWAQASVNMSGVFVGLYYGLLIAACVYAWRVAQFSLRDSNVVE